MKIFHLIGDREGRHDDKLNLTIITIEKMSHVKNLFYAHDF